MTERHKPPNEAMQRTPKAFGVAHFVLVSRMNALSGRSERPII